MVRERKKQRDKEIKRREKEDEIDRAKENEMKIARE